MVVAPMSKAITVSGKSTRVAVNLTISVNCAEEIVNGIIRKPSFIENKQTDLLFA
jgi:hypothetical protein